VDTDTELVRRHLEGDEVASQTLIERYQDMVYSLAYRMLGDGEEARDASQEVFLNALDSLPGFRGECAFSTWLYRIAANGCIARSRWRKRRRATEVPANDLDRETPGLSDDSPSSLDLVELQERNSQLYQAVAELAEEYRMAIVLHYFQGLAYEEVAQALSVPTGTVKVRLFRAKRLLKRKLAARRIES